MGWRRQTGCRDTVHSLRSLILGTPLVRRITAGSWQDPDGCQSRRTSGSHQMPVESGQALNFRSDHPSLKAAPPGPQQPNQPYAHPTSYRTSHGTRACAGQLFSRSWRSILQRPGIRPGLGQLAHRGEYSYQISSACNRSIWSSRAVACLEFKTMDSSSRGSLAGTRRQPQGLPCRPNRFCRVD